MEVLVPAGTFLLVQPTFCPSLYPGFWYRAATLGQGRAWSKVGLQLSISAAPPSLL